MFVSRRRFSGSAFPVSTSVCPSLSFLTFFTIRPLFFYGKPPLPPPQTFFGTPLPFSYLHARRTVRLSFNSVLSCRLRADSKSSPYRLYRLFTIKSDWVTSFIKYFFRFCPERTEIDANRRIKTKFFYWQFSPLRYALKFLRRLTRTAYFAV